MKQFTYAAEKPVRGYQTAFTVGGDHVRPKRRTNLRFLQDGHVAKRNQQVTFRQSTDKGYVICRATIPIGVCDRCGSRHWSEDAETIIEDAVRQEYQKLP